MLYDSGEVLLNSIECHIYHFHTHINRSSNNVNEIELTPAHFA